MALFRVTVRKTAKVTKTVFSEADFTVEAETAQQAKEAMEVAIANDEMNDWIFERVDSDECEETEEEYAVDDVGADSDKSPDCVDFRASEWLLPEDD
jgi:hypothetical protein